jgi:hypothetical protein
MANRIGDCDGAALGHPEKRESLQAEGIDNRFEIVHPGLEG